MEPQAGPSRPVHNMARTSAAPRYRVGDTITHQARPEWGLGRIRKTDLVTRDGVATQRLVVDFSSKGRVTLDTATAPIGPAPAPRAGHAHASAQDHDMTTHSGSSLSNNGGWLAELESRANGGKQSHELWDLPEALSDPFLSDEQRLNATLETYRFSTAARSLIEWAQKQTGLDDPLTKYTRTDLEQAFPRFARDRDLHLKEMVRTLKRGGKLRMIEQVRNRCQIPAAVSAIDKALRA